MGNSVFINSITVDYLIAFESSGDVVELTVEGHELDGDVEMNVGQGVRVDSSHEVVKIMPRMTC